MRRAYERVMVTGNANYFQPSRCDPLPSLNQHRSAEDRQSGLVINELAVVGLRLISGERGQMRVQPLVLEHGEENLHVPLFAEDRCHHGACPLQSQVAPELEFGVAQEKRVEKRHQPDLLAPGLKLVRDLERDHGAGAVAAQKVRTTWLSLAQPLDIHGRQLACRARLGRPSWRLQSVNRMILPKTSSQSRGYPGIAVSREDEDERSGTPSFLDDP